MTDPNIDPKELAQNQGGSGASGEEPNRQTAGSSSAPIDVEIGGKTFKLAPDIAEALKAVKTAAETSVEAANRKAAELETRLAAANKVEKPNPTDPYSDFETELFVDPTSAVKKIVEMAVNEATSKLTTAYTQSENQKAFYQEFYKAHPDLKEFDGYVRYTIQNEYAALKDLTVDKVIEKVGESVKKDILKMSGGKGKGDDGANIEGGNHPAHRRSNPVSKDSLQAPRGLSTLIKERQEARRSKSGARATT